MNDPDEVVCEHCSAVYDSDETVCPECGEDNPEYSDDE